MKVPLKKKLNNRFSILERQRPLAVKNMARLKIFFSAAEAGRYRRTDGRTNEQKSYDSIACQLWLTRIIIINESILSSGTYSAAAGGTWVVDCYHGNSSKQWCSALLYRDDVCRSTCSCMAWTYMQNSGLWSRRKHILIYSPAKILIILHVWPRLFATKSVYAIVPKCLQLAHMG